MKQAPSHDLDRESIKLNISYFFIGFFIASFLLFERFFGLGFEGSLLELLIKLIYFGGYGAGALCLLLYITFRALHYRYKDENRFGSRDSFEISNFSQEVFYDIGVKTIVSSVFLIPISLLVFTIFEMLR